MNGLAVLMTKLTVRCPEAAHTTCDRETQAKAFCTVHFLVPVAPVDLTFRFFMTRSGRYLRRARTPFVSLKKETRTPSKVKGPPFLSRARLSMCLASLGRQIQESWSLGT